MLASYAIRPQHVTAPLGLMIPQPTAGTQAPHSFDLAGEELYVSIRDLGQGAFGLVRLAVNRCSVSSDATVAYGHCNYANLVVLLACTLLHTVARDFSLVSCTIEV